MCRMNKWMIIICQRKLSNLHHYPIFQDTSTFFTFSFCLHFAYRINLHSCYFIKDLISVKTWRRQSQHPSNKIFVLWWKEHSTNKVFVFLWKVQLVNQIIFLIYSVWLGRHSFKLQIFPFYVVKRSEIPTGVVSIASLVFQFYTEKKKELLLLHVKFLPLLFSCTIVMPQLYLLLFWLNILL